MRSFRDPDGSVVLFDGRVLRWIASRREPHFRSLLSSDAYRRWTADGRVSGTTPVSEEDRAKFAGLFPPEATASGLIVEHPRIPFRGYPHEWAPAMLYRAAELTLELAEEAFDSGFELKDATPFNIVFDGPKPLFVDVLSFDQRDVNEVMWRPYAQFVRTFVYPLLARRYFGLELSQSLGVFRDGLEPERVLRMTSAWRRLVPPFLGLATLPALLGNSKRIEDPQQYRVRRARDADEASYIMKRVYRRAHQALKAARPANAPREGAISYAEGKGAGGHRYRQDEMELKRSAVSAALDLWRPGTVLDAGCNTGEFSEMAARRGARVAAIDKDPDCIGALWRRASSAGLDILPLVVDLARPTAAMGWDNAEEPSWLERFRGRFDCVLMLAILHHLLVPERIPLDFVMNLASSLTMRYLIVEYVSREDPQFVRIARGREELHRDFTEPVFRRALERHFSIHAVHLLSSTRSLYLAIKRDY